MNFDTVQDLLSWNSTEEMPPKQPLPIENKDYRDLMAKNLAKNINDKKDPDLSLEVAKYLLGSLVSWHKKVLDVKRQEKTGDAYVWAYDLAKLNAALEVLNDVNG